MEKQIIKEILLSGGIDPDLSLNILDRCNQGNLPSLPRVREDLPGLDGKQVVDSENLPKILLHHREILGITEELGIHPKIIQNWLSKKPDPLGFTSQDYYEFGILCLPLVSIGILNGGMATSYCDSTRNKSANPLIFPLIQDLFDKRAAELHNIPKGLAPAYYLKNGNPGLNFLALRLRNALLLVKEYRRFLTSLGGTPSDQEPGDSQVLTPLFPFFQMTSTANTEQILQGIRDASVLPEIQSLAEELSIPTEPWLTEVQPLLAALTHGGLPKDIFMNAWGKENTPLGLPGGHGQNFQALGPVYRSLLQKGKKFAYLGNVDNLGSIPHPPTIGYLALTGGNGGFDFSYKTPVDTKGGILIRTGDGKLSCGDIGPAISSDAVHDAESQGNPILFNCATGLFQLDYLVQNLDRIVTELPIRISDQKKDAGMYSQAEQVTWEVIGLMDKPVIFAVDKFQRFLAAKLLTDTFLTSGLIQQDVPGAEGEVELGKKLYQGLRKVLINHYGIELPGEN